MSKAQSISKRKADVLFSQIIRSIGRCEFCGRSAGVQLQAAHVISRKFGNTRTDFQNVLCLCASCHRKGHDNPLEFAVKVMGWAKANNINLDGVRVRAYSYGKVNWELRLKELQDIKKLVDDKTLSVGELRVISN